MVVTIPENFLRPKRFPGEPPWLWTVPPARFVAVRMAPDVLSDGIYVLQEEKSNPPMKVNGERADSRQRANNDIGQVKLCLEKQGRRGSAITGTTPIGLKAHLSHL